MKEFQLDRFLIASGFIGPVIFFLTIYILFPLFYPGYDMKNQTISELGDIKSPVQVFANVFGFSLLGIFIMLFACGVFRFKEINAIGKTSSVFIFIAGILVYLVGVFYGGPGGTYTTLATLHQAAANYPFPLLAAGYILFALSVLRNKKIRWLAVPIVIIGLSTLYFASMFFTQAEISSRGIIQRLAIGLPILLMAIISITLYRLKSKR